MRNHKLIAIAVFLILLLSSLAACAPQTTAAKTDGISIVSTVFPSYDFARQITAGTNASVTMLLQPGEEVHSFDPTSQDIIRVQNANLFLYVGGENDTWVENVLSGLDKSVHTFKMMDYVTLYKEELTDGMQPEQEQPQPAGTAAEAEWDEHVWTAPVNAISIVKAMTSELVAIDPANAATYQANSDAYVKQLEALDQSFWDVVNGSARKIMVFADRFPVRYFVEEFGLSYYAAFPGCSTDTEPSAATLAALIDHVRTEQIPYVFYIEMSNQKMADTVCEETGAQKLLFHTCHNVTKAEFESGATYLSLMQNNVLALQKALG